MKRCYCQNGEESEVFVEHAGETVWLVELSEEHADYDEYALVPLPWPGQVFTVEDLIEGVEDDAVYERLQAGPAEAVMRWALDTGVLVDWGWVPC